MKKFLVFILSLTLFLAACSSNNSNDNEQSDNKSENQSSENKDDKNNNNSDDEKSEKTFTQDDGEKVKVPQNPRRIAVLHPNYVGALVKFGHTPVAVPEFVDQNEVLDGATKDSERIDNNSVEQVTKQRPDLIITSANDQNINKLKKIAPTVAFDANQSSYKDTTKKLAELVNEQDKADKWLKDWDKKLADDKKELEPFLKGKTASVVQQTPKGIMAFSDHMGRGTEIIYEGYGLKQPDALKEATQTDFATPLSEEQFPEYIGDIAVIAQKGDHEPQFVSTNFWQNLPAVQNEHVISFDVSETQYNDPISLEKQRDIFYKALKEMKDK